MEVSKEFLAEKARELRIKTLKMVAEAGSGHPGGSLSEIEILVSLYYKKLRLYEDPHDERRDRFVLSKGHANPPLYAIFADKGWLREEELMTLRKTHSRLQGHPDMNKCPGIDCSTGSLGQGISVSVGMALGLKLKKSDSRVYVLTGDGELDEGIVWEAAAAAANYKLDNLTWIVDRNRFQLDGCTEDVMALGKLAEKFRAFGFLVDSIDGHNYDEIFAALDHTEAGHPHVIIANTVKGKGVDYMEDNPDWHGKVPNKEQLASALAQLEVKAHD